jgi:hypothetical protein
MRFLPALQKLSHCPMANCVVDHVIFFNAFAVAAARGFLSWSSHKSPAEKRALRSVRDSIRC